MRLYTIFFLLLSTLLFSQRTKFKEKIDSVAYDNSLSTSNAKADKYKNALFYTQKAIIYSKTNNALEYQLIQTFNLGKLYYDVKKNDDAIEAFQSSILLSASLKQSHVQATTFYYLGMCFIKKRDFEKAKITFNKAQALFDILEISSSNDLLSL